MLLVTASKKYIVILYDTKVTLFFYFTTCWKLFFVSLPINV
jgi:hypothetical protein